jgi:hypothetical protein
MIRIKRRYDFRLNEISLLLKDRLNLRVSRNNPNSFKNLNNYCIDLLLSKMIKV